MRRLRPAPPSRPAALPTTPRAAGASPHRAGPPAPAPRCSCRPSRPGRVARRSSDGVGGPGARVGAGPGVGRAQQVPGHGQRGPRPGRTRDRVTRALRPMRSRVRSMPCSTSCPGRPSASPVAHVPDPGLASSSTRGAGLTWPEAGFHRGGTHARARRLLRRSTHRRPDDRGPDRWRSLRPDRGRRLSGTAPVMRGSTRRNARTWSPSADYDAEAFREVHHPDAVSVFAVGEVAIGRDAIMEAFGPLLRGEGRQVELDRDHQVRPGMPHRRHRLPHPRSSGPGLSRHAINTVTYTFDRGRWLVISDQGTEVSAPTTG